MVDALNTLNPRELFFLLTSERVVAPIATLVAKRFDLSFVSPLT
jgi:hypothetical protein